MNYFAIRWYKESLVHVKGVFGYLLGAFFSFVFLFANNVSSIVCIVSNFMFTP
jgi:hypothetical protein